jgi:hypothetical protein
VFGRREGRRVSCVPAVMSVALSQFERDRVAGTRKRPGLQPRLYLYGLRGRVEGFFSELKLRAVDPARILIRLQRAILPNMLETSVT